jgi:uncharacterized protein (TIGR02453 family)
MAESFGGFPKDFFAFFRELKAHNERAWFEDNKPRFRESVQAPMSAFIEAMAPRVKKISKHFTCDPRPNGGSMFRIHRDVRFSRDKRPYKEHAACHFRHALGRDVHAPGFYMHFAPDEVRFGGGMWMPDPEALAKIRGRIAAKPAAWRKIAGGVQGEALSRAPRGFDPAHPLIEDIKKKSFFSLAGADGKLAQSPRLAAAVTAAFRDAGPLMKFLCDAQGVPY